VIFKDTGQRMYVSKYGAKFDVNKIFFVLSDSAHQDFPNKNLK
jgi:hypothetical protein